MIPPRKHGDRGASFLEYGAVILLVSAVVVGVFGLGVPARVASLFETGLERIGAPGSDGAPADESGDEPQYWNQAAPDEGGGSSDSGSDSDSGYDPAPPPGHPAGPPAPESQGADPDNADPEAVDAAVEELDECLSNWSPEDEVPWYVSACAWDVFQDLSPEEFGGVVRDMSEEDLYRLFESGPMPMEQEYFDWLESVRRTAHLDTLRKLDESDAYFFTEPEFDDVQGDAAAGNSPSSLEYEELDDYTLFGSGDQDPVQWEHIRQGSLGDCWLMATMGAMAAQDPGAIEDMIKENVNGTYTVTFPGQESITVTPDLPVDAAGNPEFASSNEDPPVIWPAIVEKAYAQMKGGDYSRLENWHPGAAMTAFGGGATDYAPDDWLPPWEDVTMDGLADKFENGESITLSTPLDGEGADLVDDANDTLVSAHVYFVSDVDREAGTVTVRNPWGSHTDDIVLDIDQINENFAALHAADLG
ncbi:C2 family cysteine protease [Nocardiopsis sp. RSe5-2]|uniref:C2 family cysteine protease n=1 Tax=Nocardiopsis endophytica TaxID=3018445 RepID=A0ABT4U3L8_9ACTN|nr:C2 family cysteine protease [Nocardiopsis endophytica]MDA2811069.1 C2 family cysteine protease [Nocardiopsis endophytica]